MRNLLKFLLVNLTIFSSFVHAQTTDRQCSSNVNFESDFRCLSKKDKTLVEECAKKHNIIINRNFSVYPESVTSKIQPTIFS